MNIGSYISRLSSNETVIFLFHGVIKEHVSTVRNYNRKHILESEFCHLIKGLKTIGNPISMDDLLESRTLPQKSYCITFDDGFENNYSVAAPILKEFKTPATFYITSSFVEENKMSWVDQIDFAIEQTRKKEICFMGKNFSLSSDNEKINFLKFIRLKAKGSQSFFINIEQHIRDIFEKCDVSYCNSLRTPLDLKMTWGEVCELKSDPLFTIGGHTHTHPIMSYLSSEDLDDEIMTNINSLKKSCSMDVKHFSYPEGLDFCFNQNVIDRLKSAGIQCCPTAIDGTNRFNNDLFHLRRITVV